MDGKQALYYAAIAIAVLVGISVVVSVVSALLSLAWAVVSGIVTLAVLAGLAYAAYKAGSWLLGDGDAGADSLDSIGSSSSASADAATSRQDRLRQQYVEGQISEAEFERRIGEELETEEVDDIDRELERER
jgi:nucleosome binding factor SPN SPT16 subunit